MPNFEEQIAKWRRSMVEASVYGTDLLDELEEHLREEIERLLRSGTPEDGVFEKALSNLGGPSALASEFEKLSAGSAANWLPVKIARFVVISATLILAAVLIPRIDRGRTGVLLASHVFSITLGYLTMFLMGGLSMWFICVRFVREPGQTREHCLRRATFQFASVAAIFSLVGTVLGMFWAKAHWDTYWSWDLKETGGMMVISWSTVICLLRWVRLSGPMPLVFMTVFGNLITAWAWFGTNVQAPGLLSHPVLQAFFAVQLAFLAAAVVSTVFPRKHRALVR